MQWTRTRNGFDPVCIRWKGCRPEAMVGVTGFLPAVRSHSVEIIELQVNQQSNMFNAIGGKMAWALMLLCGMGAVMGGLFHWRGEDRGGGAGFSDADAAGHRTGAERQVFFTERIQPILDANAAVNHGALETLEADIHAQFAQYRARVPKFTRDITGFGNKTKITWDATRQIGSNDKERVQRHVGGKFEMHVVGADGMRRDLERLINGFRNDVEANHNRMLAEIESAVAGDPQLIAAGVGLPETFRERLEGEIGKTAAMAGRDAVVLSGLSFLATVATEEAVRKLVTVALTRVGASLAASMGATAVASGGATTAGGVGGGGAGSLGGPAGVVIGFAAGITVGIIVDCVMSDRLEAKLNRQCTEFLTRAETELLRSPQGLLATLEKAIRELHEIKCASIRQQLQSLP